MTLTMNVKQDIDSQLERSILEKHAEKVDDFAPSIDITAFSRTGTLVPVDSLPEEYQRLINDAKRRAVAAGALSPSYLIPQLDGDDDEVILKCNMVLINWLSNIVFMRQQPDDNEINSDLDDSDDDDDDGEGAEDLEHIILCLYDKVRTCCHPQDNSLPISNSYSTRLHVPRTSGSVF